MNDCHKPIRKQLAFTRAAVPVSETIMLEVLFRNSAGFPKDPDSYPEIQVTDAATVLVFPFTQSGVQRVSVGQYRFALTVPAGFTNGLWNDHWQANLDGYTIANIFDFNVTSVGTVEEAGASVPQHVYSLDDDETLVQACCPYTQDEIRGILCLRGLLKQRLRSTAFKPDGSPCPVFSNELLDSALRASLSELNATPTLTAFRFSDFLITQIAADLITQGAMLVAWAGQAIIEAGFEFTINDNGVTVNPPPVSQAINTQYSSQLSDYRSKLKEFKRNLRPGPLGMSAGSMLVAAPAFTRLRHLSERRLI